MGNDHEIGTADGAVDVVAKDPFHSLQFAGWLRLMWGGDDSGVYVETDTGASPGSSTFFGHSSGPFHATQGSNHDLLATYGNSGRRVIAPFDWNDILIATGFGKGDPIGPGDPGPDDWIRVALLDRLLRQTRPDERGSVDFQQIIRNAQSMNAEELKRAKARSISRDRAWTRLISIRSHGPNAPRSRFTVTRFQPRRSSRHADARGCARSVRSSRSTRAMERREDGGAIQSSWWMRCNIWSASAGSA